MFGYESVVLLNDVLILANSADIAVQRNPIVSSAVYNSSHDTNKKLPLQQPHFYDWKNVTASVSLDVCNNTLSLIKGMLLNRTTPVDVTVKSRNSGEKRIQQAYWNSISIGSSQDSTLTASISFIGLDCEQFNVGSLGGYYDNGNGFVSCSMLSNSPALNSTPHNLNPIPFWKTTIEGTGPWVSSLGLGEMTKSWEFSVNQTLIKFMACEGKGGTEAQPPYALGFGTLDSSISVRTFLPQGNSLNITSGHGMWGIYSGGVVSSGRHEVGVSVNGGEYIKTLSELIQVSDPLSGAESTSEINWNYQVYQYE